MDRDVDVDEWAWEIVDMIVGLHVLVDMDVGSRTVDVHVDLKA